MVEIVPVSSWSVSEFNELYHEYERASRVDASSPHGENVAPMNHVEMASAAGESAELERTARAADAYVSEMKMVVREREEEKMMRDSMYRLFTVSMAGDEGREAPVMRWRPRASVYEYSSIKRTNLVQRAPPYTRNCLSIVYMFFVIGKQRAVMSIRSTYTILFLPCFIVL